MNSDGIRNRFSRTLPSIGANKDEPANKATKKESLGKQIRTDMDDSGPKQNHSHDAAGPSAVLTNPDAGQVKRRRFDSGKAPTSTVTEAMPKPPNSFPRLYKAFTSSQLIPGLNQTLAQLRAEVNSQGLPFVFGISKTVGLEFTTDEKIIPWATAYFAAAHTNIEHDSSGISLHYIINEELQLHTLGMLSQLSGSSHPLMGYIIRTNDVVLDKDPQGRVGLYKAAAVGHLAFANGVSVKKNSAISSAFLAAIPKDEMRDVFSCIMVEALGTGNIALAIHCLPLSDGLASCDFDGHTALTSSLNPQAEKFLKLLIADAGEPELRFLAGAKKYAQFAGWPRTCDLLEGHAASLGYTLEDI